MLKKALTQFLSEVVRQVQALVRVRARLSLDISDIGSDSAAEATACVRAHAFDHNSRMKECE